MNLLALFRRASSAPVARERLQILLAHERAVVGGSDLIAMLQEEILAVIAKHVAIDREKVQVKLDRGDAVSTLEIDIEVPDLVEAAKAKAKEKEQEKEKAAAEALTEVRKGMTGFFCFKKIKSSLVLLQERTAYFPLPLLRHRHQRQRRF